MIGDEFRAIETDRVFVGEALSRTRASIARQGVCALRHVHDKWARGDFAVGADLLAPDFEWHQFPQAVEPGTRRGPEVAEALRRMFEIYEDMRVDPREFIEAGDKVVVIGWASATARASDMPLDTQIAFVWTVRNSKLVRNEVFTDRREALEAAGLRE